MINVKQIFSNRKMRYGLDTALIGSYAVKVAYLDILKAWFEGLMTTTKGRALATVIAIVELFHMIAVMWALIDLMIGAFETVMEWSADTSSRIRSTIGLS